MSWNLPRPNCAAQVSSNTARTSNRSSRRRYEVIPGVALMVTQNGELKFGLSSVVRSAASVPADVGDKSYFDPST